LREKQTIIEIHKIITTRETVFSELGVGKSANHGL
jgi:hypothetical protein